MLRIHDIQKVCDTQECRLSAKIDCPQAGWRDLPLWFSFPAAYTEHLTPYANPFLAGVLFSAMKLQQDIQIDGIVSRKLLRGLRIIMDIYTQWFPELHHVHIFAADIKESDNVNKIFNGCFFSGGVDSFYTVLKNKNESQPDYRITHLMFAHGLDIPLENSNFYNTVLNHIQQISLELGLELISVKTNARQLNAPFLDWHETHGYALASIGLCLEPFLKAVFIPGDHDYKYMLPRGSHPLTDPFWSTESLRFIHDGCESDRIEKVRSQIARSETAMEHLRVCWQNAAEQYNCGQCEKCIRTKINLYLAGVLDRCRTFKERNINIRQIESLSIREDFILDFTVQNYNAVSHNEGDIKLKKALKKAIHSYDVFQRKKWLKSARRQFSTKIKNTLFFWLKQNK